MIWIIIWERSNSFPYFFPFIYSIAEPSCLSAKALWARSWGPVPPARYHVVKSGRKPWVCSRYAPATGPQRPACSGTACGQQRDGRHADQADQHACDDGARKQDAEVPRDLAVREYGSGQCCVRGWIHVRSPVKCAPGGQRHFSNRRWRRAGGVMAKHG